MNLGPTHNIGYHLDGYRGEGHGARVLAMVRGLITLGKLIEVLNEMNDLAG